MRDVRTFSGKDPEQPLFNCETKGDSLDSQRLQAALESTVNAFALKERVTATAIDMGHSPFETASLSGQDPFYGASTAKIGIAVAAAFALSHPNSIKDRTQLPDNFEAAVRSCILNSVNSDCAQVSAVLGGAKLKPGLSLLIGTKDKSGKAIGRIDKYRQFGTIKMSHYDLAREYTLGVLAGHGFYNPNDCRGIFPSNPYDGAAGGPAVNVKGSGYSRQATTSQHAACLFQKIISEKDWPMGEILKDIFSYQYLKDGDLHRLGTGRCVSALREIDPNIRIWRKGGFTGHSASNPHPDTHGDILYFESPQHKKRGVIAVIAYTTDESAVPNICKRTFGHFQSNETDFHLTRITGEAVQATPTPPPPAEKRSFLDRLLGRKKPSAAAR